MKIRLIQVGKTEDSYLQEGIQKYAQRLPHYCAFECITVPSVKSSDSTSRIISKKKEGESILKQIGAKDYLVLLDEKGREFNSVQFSQYLNQFNPLGNLSTFESLSFVIGGAFGFDSLVYDKSREQISLSKMTFSHQMIRLLFVEQVYRAMTILKNEPYHHI